MTTYSDTFSSETLDAFPANFTAQWGTLTANYYIKNPDFGEVDSRVLRSGNTTADTSGQHLISFDDVDSDSNRANSEVFMRFRTNVVHAGQWGAAIRASGSSGSESSYVVRGWGTTGGTWDKSLEIRRLNGGTSTLLVNSADFYGIDSALSEGTAENRGEYGLYSQVWYNLRFRVNGTGSTVTVQAKLWECTTEEPSDWLIEYNDTSANRITSAGWCGYYRTYYVNYYSLEYADVDLFSVATNGDTRSVDISDDDVHILASELSVIYTGSRGDLYITPETALPSQEYDLTVGSEVWGSGYVGYGQQYESDYEDSWANPEHVGRLVAKTDYGPQGSPTSDINLRPMMWAHNSDFSGITPVEFTELYFDTADKELWVGCGYYSYLNYWGYVDPVEEDGRFAHDHVEGWNSLLYLELGHSGGSTKYYLTDAEGEFFRWDLSSLTAGFHSIRWTNVECPWDSSDFGQTYTVGWNLLPKVPAPHYYRVRTTMP